MATNKSVIVLMPNGHRQTVKVTPNTTIIQVLEEVCKKHGYNIDDYDVKHSNRVLDLNAILRFTGLPNNAQLEMIPCTKIRSKSTVTIGIQLENGERLMGEFMPNVTLAEILQCVHLDQDLERTVLTYMHCEVYGREALKNTTLKSLGLTNGRAVLRLMYRDPEQVNNQNQRITILKALKSDEHSSTSNKNNETKSSLTIDSNKASDSIILLNNEIKEHKKSKDLDICSQLTEEKTEISVKIDKENEILKTEENQSIPSTSKSNTTSNAYTKNERMNRICNHITNEIEFLGERNAIVFNRAAIEALPKDELPDDFYDLTVDDAKVLLRDAKRLREEIEEAPFLTNVQRQLNEEKRTLNQLNKYQYTVIRIQFPDQFVLQGLFRPLETVQTIKDFVKNYLIEPNSEFVIFTAPPKYILNCNARLIDENLVPSAILHYSGPSTLKSDIKQKLTDPKKIKMQASEVRIPRINQESQIVDKDKNTISSVNRKSAYNTNTSESLSENKNKIPKWLNLPFK